MKRRLSWVLAAASFILPLGWLAWKAANDHTVATTAADHVLLDNRQSTSFLMAMLVGLLLSAAGAALGTLAYLQLRRPRHRHRRLELIVVCVPVVCLLMGLILGR